MGLDARDIAVTFSVAVEHVRGLLSAGHERLARQTSVSAGD
jgi:N-acetylmuramic acid 6-phosphate (MurNAc-6-P) etherase